MVNEYDHVGIIHDKVYNKRLAIDVREARDTSCFVWFFIALDFLRMTSQAPTSLLDVVLLGIPITMSSDTNPKPLHAIRIRNQTIPH